MQTPIYLLSSVQSNVLLSLWVILVLLAFAAIAVGPTIFWRRLEESEKRWSLDSEVERVTRRDGSREVWGPMIGSLVLLIGFTIAWMQLRTTQEEVSSSAELSQQSINAERYAQAADQLDADGLHARMAAIYVFEELATTDPAYYRPVMATLAAFVRDETGDRDITDSDLALALAILTRGIERPGDGRADDFVISLEGADLSGVELVNPDFQGFSLEDADLSGATLEGAKLGPYVPVKKENNLLHTSLQDTDLRGTTLKNAELILVQGFPILDSTTVLQDTCINPQNVKVQSWEVRETLLALPLCDLPEDLKHYLDESGLPYP